LGLEAGDAAAVETLARAIAEHEDHSLLVEVAGRLPPPEEPRAPEAYASIAATAADLVARARATGLAHVLAAVRTEAPLPPVQAWRAPAATLAARGLDAPIVLVARVAPPARGRALPMSGKAPDAREDMLVQAAARLGALLIDGIGDAFRVEGFPDPKQAVHL